MDFRPDLCNATPRPGTASFRVIDIGWQGPLNPNPLSKNEEELLLDEYLSPTKLQELTGFDDLRQVKTLEMCVDTRENSLGNFGSYLPNLKQLKLNNSLIVSVRDLGTTLSNIKVLWMARCGLMDLDGMSSFLSLKELYLAYNNLSDLSQVSMLDHLEILDLEGNNIDDITQIQYLGLCSKLSTLTVEGNLICLKPHPQSCKVVEYDYRAEVKKLIPHLKYLDEVPVDQVSTHPSIAINEDWLMVKESIKDSSMVEDNAHHDLRPGTAAGRPCSSQRSSTAQPMLTSRPQTAQRPVTSGRPGSARLVSGGIPSPESTNPNDILVEDEASDLTHGVSRVICGNPIKALRARRQKLAPSHQPSSGSTLKELGCLPKPAFDTANTNQEDIFVELRIWREKHTQRLQAIERDKAPQVLTIMHNEDDDSLSDGNEDDELRQSYDDDCNSVISSDSPGQSPLPQYPTGPASLRVQKISQCTARFSSQLHTLPKCPSPPSPQGANNSYQKSKGIRIRHLKMPIKQDTTLPQTQCKAESRTGLADEAFPVLDFDSAPNNSEPAMRRLDNNLKTSRVYENVTRCPAIRPTAVGSTDIRPLVDKNSPKVALSHQPVIRSPARTPERMALLNTVRPLTAKGILQRLPNRPALLAAPSKSSNS
ncbi:leucine-rich repeat-containing protein 56 isoform X2 [Ambystoma mexicanum]|uniref:leucine-rich repeat-containing protein 56 isoform X2 n=1 Tax=Ambystoma mexicanum TaxID=8296 RepID=UPI0037E8BE2F